MSHLPRLPLDLLRTFLTFVEQGNGNTVAKLLKIDKGEVSRRLAALEEDYGLLTEDRRKKKILTARGEEAVPVIRSLLRHTDQFAGWLTAREQRPKVLSVACGSRIAQSLVPRAAALFLRSSADWQIQIHIRRGRERILGTADGSFDLALLSHEPEQIHALLTANRCEPERLEIEDLGRERLALIAHKTSPAGRELTRLMESQPSPLTWLAQLPLAGLDAESGLREQLEQTADQPLRFCVEGGGWGTALGCARQGLGAAVVPLSLLTRDDEKHFVIGLLPERASLSERLIYRPGIDAEAHLALRQAFHDAARQGEAEVHREWHGVLFL